MYDETRMTFVWLKGKTHASMKNFIRWERKERF